MGIYVLMTKLTPEVCQDLNWREEIGKNWKKEVDRKCPQVKWIAHYALFGPYDFMDVYEADCDETAAKVSMITRASGAMAVETWPAIAWPRFIELAKEISR